MMDSLRGFKFREDADAPEGAEKRAPAISALKSGIAATALSGPEIRE
jgi:hypothetical protein